MVSPPLRGGPDWDPCGATTYKSYSAGDLEVVSRDWWPWSYVLTGEVFFLERFEGPVLHWYSSASGGTSAVKLVGDTAMSGVQALHLELADSNGAFAYINRYFDAPVRPRMGCTLFYSTVYTRSRLDLYMDCVYNDLLIMPRFRYTISSGVLQALDDNTDYVTVATLPTTVFGKYYWNYLKVVIDVENLVYVSAECGRVKETLTTALYSEDADNSSISIQLRLDARNLSDGANDVYVDNVILTGDEP